MIGTMPRSTVSQRPAPEPQLADATQSGRTKKYGDRNFQSLILPELVSVPLFTAWLRKPFRRKHTTAAR
jgi:hypothetical protein